MTTDASIVIGVEGRIEGGKVVKRTLDDISGAGARAQRGTQNLRNEFGLLNSSANVLYSALGRILTVYGAISASRALINTADQYTVIENKLRLVTDSTEELKTVQKELTQISDETFTSVTANVNLYTRLDAATRELTRSDQDLLNATAALQQTFRISGTTAAEAANSAVQFAQGLAAGALRGDEFRSVSEQNLRLMQLLSEGLGVTRGKLKEMADEGQLTAEKIFPILANSIGQLNKEAENIAPTFDAAFSKLREKFAQGIDESVRARTEFHSLGESIAALGPVAKEFGASTVGNVIVGLTDIIQRLKEVNAGFREFLENRGLLEASPRFSVVPSDYGLGPQYTEYSQDDFNVAMGGIPNVPKPGKKPEIPDDYFAKQAEMREKDLQKQIDQSEKAQESIDDVTNSLKFQLEQLKRNDVEQEIHNNLRQAGVSIDTTAGQQIAELTRQYETNSEVLEKQKRVIDGVAGATEGFFREWLTGAEGFKGAVKGMIGQLADLAFQMSVIEPIKNNIFGSSGGSGLFSLIGNFFGGSSVGASVAAANARGLANPALFGPGFATGGSMTLGGKPGIDQNQLSLNGVPIAKTGRGEVLSISPDQKGGGAGVNVYQTINVQTGVAATVAAEIASFLPKIQETTMAAINEAKLRGISP